MRNRLFQFEAGCTSHQGHVRERNEDAFLVNSEAGLWAVADGMGGHDAGDVASRLVVESLAEIESPETAVALLQNCERRVFEANRRIIELSRQRGGSVIGSTVAVLLISDDHYACLWAGDSRLYKVRPGLISQISRDHTEVEDLLANGTLTPEEASHWSNNVITRAVGVNEDPDFEITSNSFSEGDSFILCSDGLTRHVKDEEILDYALKLPAQTACDRLVSLALERGGLDNITVIVVRPWPLSASEAHSDRPTKREPTIVPAIGPPAIERPEQM